MIMIRGCHAVVQQLRSRAKKSADSWDGPSPADSVRQLSFRKSDTVDVRHTNQIGSAMAYDIRV